MVKKEKITLFLAALVIGLAAVATAQTPNTRIADVTSFKKLGRVNLVRDRGGRSYRLIHPSATMRSGIPLPN